MSTDLLQIRESSREAPRSAPSLGALFEMGFRPLYPLGIAWSAVAVATWVFAPAFRHGQLAGPWWHAHEMVWGFLATIAVGFLFTAVPNWTGRPTPRGAWLAAFVVDWLLVRAGLWIGGRWFLPAGLLDVAFFVAAAVACLHPIVQARNWRNLGVPVVLLALAAADGGYLRAVASSDFDALLRALHAGLLLVAVLSALVGRRVIPFFAMRAVPGLEVSREVATGWVSLILLLAAGALQALGLAPGVEAALLFMSAAVMAWQLLRWKPWRVADRPLLWILYLGYAGLAAGIAALGAQAAGLPVPDSLWIHILAVCGFSLLILGMATRSSLGYLGRALRLDRWSLASYFLLLAAAVLRVLALVPQPFAAAVLNASAIAWVCTCSVFVGRYGPWIIRPRADGRSPGQHW
ncbi:NnrS protein [mine drainage metagenome]|uniref:NnrS protein n=1 Tax=mine drainage metagenome TaxID=410659 RepID=A0A1J5PGC9_9ZZZZ